MPTYAYVCTACTHSFEAVQAITDDALTECPSCGGELRKKFHPVGVTFKGSGFYRTDSRAGGSGSTSSTPASTSSDSSGSSGAATSGNGSSGSSTSGGTSTSSGSGSAGSSSTSSTAGTSAS